MYSYTLIYLHRCREDEIKQWIARMRQYNFLRVFSEVWCHSVSQCVAVCVSACCSVLQCVANHWKAAIHHWIAATHVYKGL